MSNDSGVVLLKTTNIFYLIFMAFDGLRKVTWETILRNTHLTVEYWKWVMQFSTSRERWYSIAWCFFSLTILGIGWTLVLFVLAFITPFIIPIGIAAVIASSFILVDQYTYPKNPVDQKFVAVENKDLSRNDRGALLFEAAYNQMEKELASTLGWCPNDTVTNPFAYLDNRCMRQRGVWYATNRAVAELSQGITKFGISDEENTDTRDARLHLGNFPDQWGAMGMFSDASENHYGKAGEFINSFTQNARDPEGGVTINVRSDDLVEILEMLTTDKGILSEPYGGLTSRGEEMSYSDLDDRVYYAQGAAIVARDIAVALRSSYPAELSRGGLDNLDAAIDSLNSAADFNPWWVSRGDHASQFADHRAKMQRYFTEAFRRLEDLEKSLKS